MASTTQAAYTGGVGLARHDDRVGRVLRRVAVGLAERGRVGQVGVARHHLVLDAQLLELPAHAGLGGVGHGG